MVSNFLEMIPTLILNLKIVYSHSLQYSLISETEYRIGVHGPSFYTRYMKPCISKAFFKQLKQFRI